VFVDLKRTSSITTKAENETGSSTPSSVAVDYFVVVSEPLAGRMPAPAPLLHSEMQRRWMAHHSVLRAVSAPRPLVSCLRSYLCALFGCLPTAHRRDRGYQRKPMVVFKKKLHFPSQKRRLNSLSNVF
jgi:hypothetical protein